MDETSEVAMKSLSYITIVFIVLISAIFAPLFINRRPLTENERILLESMYGESVHYGAIRIKHGGLPMIIYPGLTIGNTITFPRHWEADTAKRQALLVHEGCHVWQYQNFGPGYIPRALFETLTERNAYSVNFDEAKSFSDYDIEEQCEIVAEYFLTGNEAFAPYIAELN